MAEAAVLFSMVLDELWVGGVLLMLLVAQPALIIVLFRAAINALGGR